MMHPDPLVHAQKDTDKNDCEHRSDSPSLFLTPTMPVCVCVCVAFILSDSIGICVVWFIKIHAFKGHQLTTVTHCRVPYKRKIFTLLVHKQWFLFLFSATELWAISLV